MKSLNKVMLIGNLGSDPELRHTTSGQAVASFNVATNESWGGKDGGERQERTEWHKIVMWARLAEIANEYLRKGHKVYIEGRLQTRQWQDQQGNKRYTTEIVAQTMLMLGGRGGGQMGDAPMGGGGDFASAPPARRSSGSQTVATPDTTDAPDSGGDFFEDDSDLPF